jgi:hypothetical protein
MEKITTTGVLTYVGEWAILQCDLETVVYYHWWLERFGVKVNLPVWKSHVSVVRGEELPNPEAWGDYQDEEIEFWYSPSEIYWNGEYWWIDVYSPRLEAIRQELGLSPQPEYSLHWTIGKEYERRWGCKLGVECYNP